MSTPWKPVTGPADVPNLNDIIAEAYAESLRIRDLTLAEQSESTSNNSSLEPVKKAQNVTLDDDCNDDSVIAKNLQIQFDKEYDEIYREKTKRNGTPKLTKSYDKTLDIFPTIKHDCELNTIKAAATNDWERFEINDRTLDYCHKQKSDTKDKAKIIKYDMINGRRMACNLLDEPARRILCKLFSNGDLKSINGIISMGKKSVILHATAGKIFNGTLPEEYAIKIFKAAPNKFKTGDKFISHDCEFKNPREIASMRAEKEMLNMRQLYFENYPNRFIRNESYHMTQFMNRYNNTDFNNHTHWYFEFYNPILNELYDRGRSIHSATCANNIMCLESTDLSKVQLARRLYVINSPRLRFRSEHILITTFVGQNEIPAPKLRDVIMTPKDWQDAYNKVEDAMYELYQKGRLIHGHLNANNILWWKKTCYFIDFSQAVQRDHPSGYKFLLRDCHNICNIFIRKGVQDIKSKEKLFEQITGFEVAHFGRV